MDPNKLFFDERFKNQCVYCGSPPTTRDHVPSKVLLNQPYPQALPVVACCVECNNSFSSDEVYLACFIECVIQGSTEPNVRWRPKIKRILEEKLDLQSKIEKCKTTTDKGLIWNPEESRVLNVIIKLARGHAAYEISEPQMQNPSYLSILPITNLKPDVIAEFEASSSNTLWPEIGSRAFIRAALGEYGAAENGWIIVQRDLYRYKVTYDGTVCVKIVISEYLYCEIEF